MDFFVVYFQIADSEQELPVRRFANVGEDVGNCKGNDARACGRALHGECFTSSCHTIGKHGAVITFHNSSHQTLSRGIVDFCIVIMSGKYVVYKQLIE